jgi:hypothetical protein
MTRNISLVWFLAAAVCMSACNETTSQYKDPPASAPDGLNYTDPNLFTQGVPITPLVPEVRGIPSSYFVTPDLPGGLVLGSNGVISGTPSEPRATATYLVTAANATGSSTFGVRITVHGRFTVSGLVSGLTGTGLVLTNNGTDNLAVSANGPFAFGVTLPVGAAYSVAVTTQPAGQSCSVGGGSGYLANVNYGGVTVTCADVNGKATRATANALTSAVQALAGNRPGRVLYLTCADASSSDSIQGSVIDQATGVVTPLGDVIHQFATDAALSEPMQCGAHSVATDGAWIYVRNTATHIVSVYSAGYGPIGSMVTTTR